MVIYQHEAKKSMQYAALVCLLLAGLVSTISAVEQSSCISCHLDEAMLVKNLSEAVTKTSSLQSGSG